MEFLRTNFSLIGDTRLMEFANKYELPNFCKEYCTIRDMKNLIYKACHANRIILVSAFTYDFVYVNYLLYAGIQYLSCGDYDDLEKYGDSMNDTILREMRKLKNMSSMLKMDLVWLVPFPPDFLRILNAKFASIGKPIESDADKIDKFKMMSKFFYNRMRGIISNLEELDLNFIDLNECFFENNYGEAFQSKSCDDLRLPQGFTIDGVSCSQKFAEILLNQLAKRFSYLMPASKIMLGRLSLRLHIYGSVWSNLIYCERRLSNFVPSANVQYFSCLGGAIFSKLLSDIEGGAYDQCDYILISVCTSYFWKQIICNSRYFTVPDDKAEIVHLIEFLNKADQLLQNCSNKKPIIIFHIPPIVDIYTHNMEQLYPKWQSSELYKQYISQRPELHPASLALHTRWVQGQLDSFNDVVMPRVKFLWGKSFLKQNERSIVESFLNEETDDLTLLRDSFCIGMCPSASHIKRCWKHLEQIIVETLPAAGEMKGESSRVSPPLEQTGCVTPTTSNTDDGLHNENIMSSIHQLQMFDSTARVGGGASNYPTGFPHSSGRDADANSAYLLMKGLGASDIAQTADKVCTHERQVTTERLIQDGRSECVSDEEDFNCICNESDGKSSHKYCSCSLSSGARKKFLADKRHLEEGLKIYISTYLQNPEKHPKSGEVFCKFVLQFQNALRSSKNPEESDLWKNYWKTWLLKFCEKEKVDKLIELKSNYEGGNSSKRYFNTLESQNTTSELAPLTKIFKTNPENDSGIEKRHKNDAYFHSTNSQDSKESNSTNFDYIMNFVSSYHKSESFEMKRSPDMTRPREKCHSEGESSVLPVQVYSSGTEECEILDNTSIYSIKGTLKLLELMANKVGVMGAGTKCLISKVKDYNARNLLIFLSNPKVLRILEEFVVKLESVEYKLDCPSLCKKTILWTKRFISRVEKFQEMSENKKL